MATQDLLVADLALFDAEPPGQLTGQVHDLRIGRRGARRGVVDVVAAARLLAAPVALAEHLAQRAG